MASVALVRWQTVRLTALADVEAECLAVTASVPARPLLTDELLRGSVMLLSAHFQGFCRDLYSECVQSVVKAAPLGMQTLVQSQCVVHRQLETKNPTFETVCADFNRFGLDLSAAIQPISASQVCVTHLSVLNSWRNFAAHSNPLPPSGVGTLSVVSVGTWRISCDRLAAEMDRAMYNLLVAATGTAPW